MKMIDLVANRLKTKRQEIEKSERLILFTLSCSFGAFFGGKSCRTFLLLSAPTLTLNLRPTPADNIVIWSSAVTFNYTNPE